MSTTGHASLWSNPPRRPPLALVLNDSRGEPQIDWSSWYLDDEENHVETPEHFLIGDGVHGSVDVMAVRKLAVFARPETRPATVMRNTVFAWMQKEQNVRVCPDLYVMFDAPDPLPRSFQTWLEGHKAPDLALEIVSDEREKEYEVNPAKYASLGTGELIIYDPRRFGSKWKGEEVAPLQRYRRQDDGVFERCESGVDTVYCATLGVYLVSKATSSGYRLRLALDASGETLVPTREEAMAELGALAERERTEKERLAAKLRALGIDPDAA